MKVFRVEQVSMMQHARAECSWWSTIFCYQRTFRPILADLATTAQQIPGAFPLDRAMGSIWLPYQ